MKGRQAEAMTASAVISALVNTLTLPVRTLVAERNSLTGARSRSRVEVDRLLEHVLQRVVVGGIELVGRDQPAHQVEHQERRRVVERVVVQQPVERRGLQRAHGRGMADPPPEAGERLLRALAPAFGQAVGQHHGVHGPGAGGRHALERDPLVLEQPVEHAPGEGAVGAAALQREVDRLDRGVVGRGLRGRAPPAARSWCVSMASLPWFGVVSARSSRRRPAAPCR